MNAFEQTRRPTLIGVVHLAPLPGSPTSECSFEDVLEQAISDAQALHSGGADGLIIENFGDAPFARGQVDATTIAFMTHITLEIKRRVKDLEIGVNVLRNDASGALAIAAATGADFIRVNVHTGSMATDQGIITGLARQTLLQRRRFALNTRIAADVHVKHATPMPGESLIQSAKDTFFRGRAHALILTGSGTGQPTDADQLRSLAREVPNAPIWIGSGLNPNNVDSYRGLFHTAIVGTWLHQDNTISQPIDINRVKLMRQSLDG